jgi:NADPH:quinone reductase-like Zn-dependent oxidoreductase
VGSVAVQLAHGKGATVIATTSTDNVDFVRSLGADEVIDYTATQFQDAVHDVDVVFDTVGGDVTERSWATLKAGGMLVTVAGMPDAEKAAEHGVRTSGVQLPQAIGPVLEELLALIQTGELKPEVGHVFPLGDAEKAHTVSQTGHGRGRIVLQVGS